MERTHPCPPSASLIRARASLPAGSLGACGTHPSLPALASLIGARASLPAGSLGACGTHPSLPALASLIRSAGIPARRQFGYLWNAPIPARIGKLNQERGHPCPPAVWVPVGGHPSLPAIGKLNRSAGIPARRQFGYLWNAPIPARIGKLNRSAGIPARRQFGYLWNAPIPARHRQA